MKEYLTKLIKVTNQLTNKIVNVKQKTNTLITQEQLSLLTDKLTEISNIFNTKRKLYALSEKDQEEIQSDVSIVSESQAAYLIHNQKQYFIRYNALQQKSYFTTDLIDYQFLQFIEIENGTILQIAVPSSSQITIWRLIITVSDSDLNILYQQDRLCFMDHNIEYIKLPSIPASSCYKINYEGFSTMSLFGQLMKISIFTDDQLQFQEIFDMDIHQSTDLLLVCNYTNGFCAMYQELSEIQFGKWKLVVIPPDKMSEYQLDYSSTGQIITFASQFDYIELPNFSYSMVDRQIFYDNSTIEKQNFFKSIEGTYTYTQKDTNITHTVKIQSYTMLDVYNQSL